MFSASATSPRALLLLLLALAAAHGATSALVRPLYQVSDEVNYLASVQIYALSAVPNALAPCVSPPNGELPPASAAPGGKTLFRASGGKILAALCRARFGEAAVPALRVLGGLSLMVVTWCGWHAATLLTGGTLVPALTALALATQPVLAKYAGAATPDSPANACAALAILCVLRWLVLGPSLRRLMALVAASTAAAAFKDTGLFLVPVNGLVVVSTLAWLAWREPRRRIWLVAGALTALVVLPSLVLMTRTGYAIGPGMTRALVAPFTFMGEVVAETLGRLPVFVGSAYSSLGGFGGTAARLPATAAAVAVALWAAALVGLWQTWRDAPALPQRVLAYLVLLGVACLIQAPTRQVLLGMTDQHQGRWLFPVALPVALAMATGLARVGGARSWALVTLAHLTLMGSTLAAVLQYHVTSPGWALDRAHLYLHSTGGLDIGVDRTADQVLRAWAAAGPPGPAVLVLLSCLACGALLLGRRPVPGPTHVHHADHR